MVDSLTPNYNFTLPEVGASDDTWGNKLNTNWANLDTILKTKMLNVEDGGTIKKALNIFPADGTNATFSMKGTGAAGTFIFLEKGQPGQLVQIQSLMAGKYRWVIDLGNSTPESGANAGSDFAIHRYADGGGILSTVFSINRANGTVSFSNAVSITGTLSVAGAVNFGSTFTVAGASSFPGGVTGDLVITGAFTANSTFQSSDTVCILGTTGNGTIYLRPRGPSSSMQSWLDSNGDFHTTGKVMSGGYSYGDGFIGNSTSVYLCTSAAGTVYLRPNGIGSTSGQFSVNNAGDVVANGEITSTGSGNGMHAGIGLQCRAGTAGGFAVNRGNFYWNGTYPMIYIDATPFTITGVSCDYRIKQDVKPLQSVWNKVKKLRPVSYKRRDYEVFKADGQVRWGFLAHELQETLLPTAATGAHNGKELQSPDLLSVVAALTSALQEAQIRIEALEAKIAA